MSCRYEDLVGQPAAPTFIDVFCGCGGFSLGFKWAGYQPVLGIEILDYPSRTYVDNIRAPVFRDGVERFLESLEEHTGTFDSGIPQPGQVDVIIGGPPCQGFSRLGRMYRNGDRAAHHDRLNGLWHSYSEIISWFNPKAVVTENIPLYLKTHEYASFVESLESMGYQIAQGVLNAADFGVPQRRKRAISIALQDRQPSLPQGTTEPPVTVREAISHLTESPDGKNWHVPRHPTAKSIERYRTIPPGGNRFDLIRLRPDITPPCWLNKPSGTTDVFGRLWWDRPAGTIRTEFLKPEKGRYLHPSADRPITPREAACLQSFPDSYHFVGSATAVARQIGEAVPPLLAQSVAEHLRAIAFQQPKSC